jgi:hypothetical protein
MRFNIALWFTVIFLNTVNSYSQITGGQEVFKFINIPASARIAAMGGINQAMMDRDVAFMFQNPATLSRWTHNHAHINNSFFSTGSSFLTAAYSRNFNKLGYTGFGLQYINYGVSAETTPDGTDLGNAYAQDLVGVVSVARPLSNKANYGISLKYTNSNYNNITASGIMADVGIAFADSAEGFYTGIVLKNFGTMLGRYTKGTDERLPMDLQAGISKRLTHTPFLFSLTLHHLLTWDIRYDDPALRTTNIFDADTTGQKEKKYIADKLFRHAIFGTELYLGKVLRANIAYNHLRRMELAFNERRGLSGFSFGLQLALNRWGFSYSYALYNTAAANNALSLYVNIGEFFPKSK